MPQAGGSLGKNEDRGDGDMASRFTELIIDCGDAATLGRFWAAVLDYDITDEDHDCVFIEGPAGSGPGLLFSETTDPKTEKNRLHIDVNPTDRDQAEEVERLIGLGARRIDIGQGDQSWEVLADPEGNEFCVLRRRVA